MSDIIKTLRESNSLLLKAEAEDIAKWSKLRHTKSDLELFLQFNIAEIEFRTLDVLEIKKIIGGVIHE